MLMPTTHPLCWCFRMLGSDSISVPLSTCKTRELCTTILKVQHLSEPFSMQEAPLLLCVFMRYSLFPPLELAGAPAASAPLHHMRIKVHPSVFCSQSPGDSVCARGGGSRAGADHSCPRAEGLSPRARIYKWLIRCSRSQELPLEPNAELRDSPL